MYREQICTLNPGEVIYLKAVRQQNGTQIYRIATTHYYNISGNINSIIYGDNFTNDAYFYEATEQYTPIFSNSGVISAKNLVLPAEKLCECCYKEMFKSATYLNEPPKLKSTHLAKGCYNSMFDGCNYLVKSPELPAKELATYCYEGMFRYCYALQANISLPAKKLVDGCYHEMFYFCNNLKYIKCDAKYNISEDPTYTLKGMLVKDTTIPGTTYGTFIYKSDSMIDWQQDNISYGSIASGNRLIQIGGRWNFQTE